MTRQKAVFAVLALAVVLFATGFAFVHASDCDCPKEDFTKHGAWAVIVDKELSTAEAPPVAGPFGFAKSMTICMTYDPTNKGYAANANLFAEGSIDGRTWYPLTLAGTKTPLQGTNLCVGVSPTRYVRVGWGPTANVQSPGPRVTASVQVGY